MGSTSCVGSPIPVLVVIQALPPADSLPESVEYRFKDVCHIRTEILDDDCRQKNHDPLNPAPVSLSGIRLKQVFHSRYLVIICPSLHGCLGARSNPRQQ